MGLFDKMKEPVFLKESSDAQIQLERLRELEPLLNEEGKTKIRQDIKSLEYGIAGEKNIAFELKNSHMPMYILHDIYLEDGNLSAQIDYLVFTKKLCFVIECKNLYGNIEINNAGDFIRTIEFGGKRKNEGIYSPITQNQRHLDLMKKIRKDKKNNIITKYMADKTFDDFNKSVVVLANPKTVLNAQFATKEVKDKVIRADQLVNYIKNRNLQCKESESSEDRMLLWAKFYLELHKEKDRDYLLKYEPYRSVTDVKQVVKAQSAANQMEEPIDAVLDSVPTGEKESGLFEELKAFRLAKSREEKIKAYYIYNDKQLEDLILKMPGNKEALQTVSGFGKVKADKYGDDILQMINKYLK